MIVRITRRAEKELEALAPTIRAKVWKHIHTLETFPYPKGSVKLKGSGDIYRIRVGNYRILYIPNKNKISVMRIRHRREAYR
ncbi:MAG: hypothetical protein A2Z24_02015 [Candidatus Woykebacteria bacterium RBG_16_44_10]|uniref:Plasmid stabilization protein n=1 Tax=Candidatus Woykebacteria bacterium RBG_16_44_10 TaxID=1802597 RepID=A0A1G1WF69_9BACT|nr:MAG: hypothetical protein A2Z24_02015 [Candidatus Woykebacteria bacterium RBG_16_44_10]